MTSVSSGGTLLRAASACRELGAKEVYAGVTHPVFSAKAQDILSNDAIQKIVVTDTVPVMHIPQDIREKKVVVLSTALLLARAIECIYQGGSIVGTIRK